MEKVLGIFFKSDNSCGFLTVCPGHYYICIILHDCIFLIKLHNLTDAVRKCATLVLMQNLQGPLKKEQVPFNDA